MTVTGTLMKIINERNWALLPSDPAVFDDMIQQYGVEDTKVQEVLTLEFEDLEKDGPVHGLIFISRYIEEQLPNNFEHIDPDAENIVFTAQVVTNVCGTLALLAVLFNADIQNKGRTLNNFLEFTKGFSPINRGVCLGNSPEIRRIHDAYAIATHKAETIYNDVTDNDSNDDGVEYISTDDYHYITYIYKNGYLWELDGLKIQPVKVCRCEKENWLEAAKPLLEQRMNTSMDNNDGEITFSLMAITHDSSTQLFQQNELLKNNIKRFEKVYDTENPVKLKTIRNYKTQLTKEADTSVPDYALLEGIWDNLVIGRLDAARPSIDIIREHHITLNSEVQLYQENRKIAQEDAIRQKTDYFPFINKLLEKSYKRKLLDDVLPKKNNKRTKVSPSASSTRNKKRRVSTK